VEADQDLTSSGQEQVLATARAAAAALDGKAVLIATSRFKPATLTAKIIAGQLDNAEIVEWDDLTPTNDGAALDGKVTEVVKAKAHGGLVLVGHHPRLSQAAQRISGSWVEIDQGRGIWFEGAHEGGKLVAKSPITALDTVSSPPPKPAAELPAAQNLSLIAELAEGLGTLAQLEAKDPIMGARVKDFTVEIKRVCELAYDHLLKTLTKIAVLSGLPSKAEHAKLMTELASTHDHDWFKNVAKICDALAALRSEFGDTLSAHRAKQDQERIAKGDAALQWTAPSGFELMIDAIYEGERSFENDIAGMAYTLEELLRQSQRSQDIMPAAEAAFQSRRQIQDGLGRLRVAANRIIGSGKEGSKLLEQRAEEVLRDDPYFMFKAGSLLLIMLLAAATMIAKTVSFYMFPLITGFALTGVIVISALQLKASGKLPDATFLKLMELALLKFFAPLTKQAKS
jgi:phosphohistidine phosphatase SixA